LRCTSARSALEALHIALCEFSTYLLHVHCVSLTSCDGRCCAGSERTWKSLDAARARLEDSIAVRWERGGVRPPSARCTAAGQFNLN